MLAKLGLSRKFVLDWAERIAFVVAYVVVSQVIVALGGLDQAWVSVIIPGLAAVKGILAKRVGDPDSAGFLQ